MNKLPLKPAKKRKRANVDTVRSILENKGSDVVSISPDATVYDAVAEMARREVGALVVVAGEELVGIISERDYARKVILRGRSSRETLVREVMTPSPITVTLSQTIDECLQIVHEKCIRHLPVLDRGELRGLVSIGDLVRTIISSQAYTIDELRSYIKSDYPS